MSGRTWTPEEIKVVKARYPHERCEVVAKAIGRTMSAVHQCARKLGISKSPEFFASEASGRVTSERSIGARFKPGHSTWNKGMKGIDIGGKETRFKSGNKPHTWRPIGSERYSKDGYLIRKISDTGIKSADWVLVHQHVWEQHNGPIPAGHIVAFKDGNHKNISIENLECISFAENMKRNTVHNYPKEIAELIQLRGALNRRINRMENQNEQ